MSQQDLEIQELLDAIREKIVADRVIDPLETTQAVLSVAASYIGAGEMQKLMHSFPHDMQSLFPALASAA